MTAPSSRIVPIRQNSAAGSGSSVHAETLKMRRERILDVAMQAFARHGFEGASLPKIAHDAGTKHPNILYHFESKEGLWRAAIDHAFSHERERLLAITQTAKDLDPLAMLKVMVRATVHFAHRHPLHFAIVMQECQSPSPRFDWLVTHHLQPIHRQFNAVAKAAILAGQLKRVAPASLAMILLGAINSFFAMPALVEMLYECNPADEKSALDHADWIIESIFRGIEIEPASRG